MTNDELLSKTISYLRFPLTVGVVFIHFSLNKGLTIHGIKHGLENPDWFFFIVNLIGQAITRICVPLFFIISGFLFFYRKDFNACVYKEKLKSRAMTLLVPFILWNVIAIIWHMKFLLPGISSSYSKEVHFSFMRLINTFFCNTNNSGIFVSATSTDGEASGIYPIDFPLWYVRDLMVMVIFSPIVYWLVKRIGGWFVMSFCLVWLFSALFIPKGSYVGMLVTALFFFSWGAFYSINGKNFVLSFRKLKFAPVIYPIIAIADVLTIGLEYHSYIHKSGILVGVVSAVVIASYLLEAQKVKVNPTLANSSFFIFALHGMFIQLVGKFAFIVLHIPENNPFAMLALYFTVPIFSVAVSLMLYVLLKRYAPKLCNLLTGGR